MKTAYQITIEFTGDGSISEDVVTEFAHGVGRMYGTISAGGTPPKYSATFTWAEALNAAVEWLVKEAAHAGMPPWPITEIILRPQP